jgi:catechol 2,3-dioxygenase-like lactoylglutathione lyase family enzyme
MTIEAVVLPVSDVERAKTFYERVGFGCDTDHEPNENFRIVQLTPPGSACSIIVGKGIPQGEPGSVQGVYLVVEDLAQAVAALTDRGFPVSEPFHFGPEGQVAGLEPNRAPYASFATLADPDGNTWLLQEIPAGGHVR